MSVLAQIKRRTVAKNEFSLGCVVVGSVVECEVAKCQTVQMRKPNQETQLKSSQAKHHSGERKIY